MSTQSIPGAQLQYDPSETERARMVRAMTAAIRERWADARLSVSAEDEVRAGLAALELVDAAIDIRRANEPNESKPS